MRNTLRIQRKKESFRAKQKDCKECNVLTLRVRQEFAAKRVSGLERVNWWRLRVTQDRDKFMHEIEREILKRLI